MRSASALTVKTCCWSTSTAGRPAIGRRRWRVSTRDCSTASVRFQACAPPAHPTCHHVDPAFLETMEIPVLLGRGLKPADLASPTVAVVNQKFASTYFGGENPVGRQFAIGKPTEPLLEIVGVTRAAHYNSFQEGSEPVAYLPYTQNLGALSQFFFEIRTAGPQLSAAAPDGGIVH